MTELETALAAFLPTRRWFAGKRRRVDAVRVEASVPLREAPPSLRAVVAAVAYADGGVERYHLPLGHDDGPGGRALADAHPDAVVLRADGGVVYDAVHDERLGAVWLDLLARRVTVDGLRFARAPGLDGPLDGPGRLCGAEQSNSSLVFAERLILKLFRLLEPGENPELEVTRALAAHGFGGCPAPLGWVEGLGSTLGILQRFYAGSVEGWELATGRVAEHYRAPAGAPANFAAEAAELGRVTAELHAAMAAALPGAAPGEPDPDWQARLLGQLADAIALVPELAERRDAVATVYAKAAAGDGPAHRQRIHGDYHLGQVLRTAAADGPARWLVLDFEGEPARSLEERRRPASPLQDVAGMLRSFDYAAFQPLVLGERDGGRLERRAADWIAACRAAFLDAYWAAAAGAGWLGGDHELQLRAFELDKAVYEVRYEARHRPAWLQIPLGGIRRLLEVER